MVGFSSGVYGLGAILAQLSDPGIDTPEEAALIFSGPQFFIALISGLVLAFGFQLLLTNLSVAAGISYVGHSSSSGKGSSSSSGLGRIGAAFGIWTLVTVSLALFFACLLAVKLSLYNSALLGAITGLVIWGTYFSLLFWVSSTTVGSLIGSVVSKATAGFQALVGTATAAIGAKTVSNEVVQTAEATAAAVRRELMSVLHDDDLHSTLQDYLVTLRSPELDTQELESEFERLIADSDLVAIADRETLSQLDRDVFEKLVSSRTDLSRQETQRIADRLYRSWRKALGQAPGSDPMTEFVSYLRTAQPSELGSDRLNQRLEDLVAEMRQRRKAQQESQPNPLVHGLSAALPVLLGRSDLSDVDAETVLGQLKRVKDEVSNQISDDSYSLVQADVENYLLNSYPWQLQPQRLEAEFRDVIYDPAADARYLRQELRGLDHSYFTELLESRGLLTPAEVERTVHHLELVRQRTLSDLNHLYRLESAKALEAMVYVFLQETPREELLSDQGEQAFAALLEDSEADADDLRDRFSQFSSERFAQILQPRTDLTSDDVQQIASRLERVMARVLADAEGLQATARVRIDNQRQALEDYLRRTGKPELNPEGIKRDLKTLLHEPDAGMHRLRQRLGAIDRDTLLQLLAQRNDLSEAEARRIMGDVEGTWRQIIHAPAALSESAQARYDQATESIADYLRRTGKPELNPEGIRRDLKTLLEDPKAGAEAMRLRLRRMDRDTLVQLLAQRDDLSEAEVNRIIDDILATIREVLRIPQRLARRAQARVVSFEAALEDYLRSTDKAALNPEGIKRDLKLLLDDPQLGGQRLQSRLAAVDRDTLVQLLAQRDDMSEAEAAEAVDQVLAVRDQVYAQIRQVQDQIKSVIRGILARIRQYLNSLGRPELNYYGIKRDVQRLFDDPQAGFEALKLRLSQFDRDTLVALVSSHDAVSEADAYRVIEQVESARDSALHKAERLEREVENRINELKLSAQHQFEETRKSAEIAAWWLFGTATISAVCAALGGLIAVGG